MLISVARRLPVETDNSSAWAKVKYRLSDSAIINDFKRGCKKVLINLIIRTRSRHFRHAYHSTGDNIVKC
jgi:hypothetical protein